MALNVQNLKPVTKENARERGRNGGLAAAKSKKRKKSLRECAKIFAELPVDEGLNKQLKKLGVNEDDVSYLMAMVVTLAQKSLKGDNASLRTYLELLGEDDRSEAYKKQLELKAKEVEIRERELQLKMDKNSYVDLPVVIGGEDELED